MRYKDDFFVCSRFYNEILKINYMTVLSMQKENWDGEKGYVQYAVLNQKIELKNAQVYACGSFEMIVVIICKKTFN